jgi:hypothetical protein
MPRSDAQVRPFDSRDDPLSWRRAPYLIQKGSGTRIDQLVCQPSPEPFRIRAWASPLPTNYSLAIERANNSRHFQPGAVKSRDRAQGNLAIPTQCSDERAFRSQGHVGFLPADALEAAENLHISLAGLDDDDALAGGGNTLVDGECGRDSRREIQPSKAGARQDQRIELAVVEFP